MSNGKAYYFNVPYNSSKKFQEYISDEKDNIGLTWFGYERDKIVDTMYSVQFHLCDYEDWDSEYNRITVYQIHYHMMSTDGYEKCYNPRLTNKEKEELKFTSIEEACDFLIKFMEENEITEVNVQETAKDIRYLTREIKRDSNIINRITEALNYN